MQHLFTAKLLQSTGAGKFSYARLPLIKILVIGWVIRSATMIFANVSDKDILDSPSQEQVFILKSFYNKIEISSIS